MKKFSDFTEEQIQSARESVAKWWEENRRAVRRKDNYAPHVTEDEKDQYLREGISYAREIAAGLHDGCFTVAQRIYAELTGECPALLP